MVQFYGHAADAPYEERDDNINQVDQKFVVTNEQESQAAFFVCQDINSEVKNLHMEVASLRQSIDHLKAKNAQDPSNKPTSKKLPKGLSVSNGSKLVLK